MHEMTSRELMMIMMMDTNTYTNEMKPFLYKSSIVNHNNDRSPYAVSFDLIFNDEYNTNASTKSISSKSVTFILIFDYVTLLYDPLSTWLLRFVDILTPLSPRYHHHYYYHYHYYHIYMFVVIIFICIILIIIIVK
jgi:hypothetical protein